MSTVDFTPAKLKKLKAEYAKAKVELKDRFYFEGNVLLISYAKYLIEYLEGVLDVEA
jgi:hypothetical protein